MNGEEIGGGSIRIHDASLQQYILEDILKVCLFFFFAIIVHVNNTKKVASLLLKFAILHSCLNANKIVIHFITNLLKFMTNLSCYFISLSSFPLSIMYYTRQFLSSSTIQVRLMDVDFSDGFLPLSLCSDDTFNSYCLHA